MSNMDLFKQIAADPQNFVINAPEKDGKSKAATSHLQDKLSDFADTLDDFAEQYRLAITKKYYEDPDLDDVKDEWADDEFGITEHEADEIEFSAFRTQFMDVLKEAAILLNLDEGDITSAYDFDYEEVKEGFFMMQDDNSFTDEDALRVLDGIQKEIAATLLNLKGVEVKTVPPISGFLSETDDGTMYDDPSGP